MNRDVFEGTWKQARGQAREWWSRFTDDDLDKVGGELEAFIGLIQEKYGYSREKAEAEYGRWMDHFLASQKKPSLETPS